ncbi:MAG: diguanylate cyclase [Deltaproteobacteria bacterium]|nr:diguanylate cyclase [Deltaproteobacteria bacterium]MBW2136447.1 diguanylate cyclase [Deltaproteobacteria bacterium]
METQEFLAQLVYSGKDPSQLIFEDELTGLYNRRFLHQYLESRVDWNSLKDNPLSLMMIDVDDFKTINDRFGHETGDRALIWIAELIREVAEDNGLAIRYAGDEFIVLLAHFTKEASIERGTLLRRRIHDRAFEPGDTDTPVPMTLSIGIASAPDDALTGKELVQKADTALYSAKRKGRDCVVHASEVKSEEVFEKAATYQLSGTNLVGRNQQISQVAKALKEFSKKKNQFIIVEGSGGIGKSEFIEAVRRNIAKKQVLEVKLKGTRQEDFRPYYLIVNLLTELLNKKKDRGQNVLEELDPKERAYLSQVFPQLGASDEPIREEEEVTIREGIFETLVRFIEKIVGKHLLFLFIDDFHLADEASMLLLRRLMQGHEMPLFICASSSEWAEIRRREERSPLERFYGIYRKELDIKKIPLTPLEPGHIARYIKRIFPNLRPPESFVNKLAKISRGNPYFINEILRKLITDQKIILRGHEWIIQRIEDDYLPSSLDEIVNQKIEALDEDSRRLLEQVSVMGEEVSLSMLLGSSDVMEGKALEFIDKVSAQGILKSDFEVNDEVIRFLGKQVLDIIYGSIDQERRQDLHEHIGKYHEKLYRENVLTSAASLAYHFKRSANREKAENYEKMLLLSNARQFDPDEAFNYGGGEGEGPIEEELPIGEEDIGRIPQLIRDFMVAVRNVRLYPKGSRSVTNMTLQLKSSVDEILEKYSVVHIKNVENAIVVNDVELDTKDFKLVANSFVELMKQFQLTGIAFRKGLGVKEVEEMLEAFSQTERQVFDENHWKEFMSRKGLNHIDLKQVRYAVKKGKEGTVGLGEEEQEITATAPPGGGARWSKEEMGLIVEIVRSLLGASRTIKLYPIESRITRSLLGALNENLQRFLERRGVLTLSRAEDTLLVNGSQVPSIEFRKVAANLVRYFEVIGLNSLTFLRGVSIKEIETYVNTLGHLPKETGSAFWQDLATSRGLRGVLFDRQIYELDIRDGMGGLGPEGGTEAKGKARKEAGGEGYLAQEEPPEEDDDSFEKSLATYPDRVKEMLLDMDEHGIKDANEELFQDFEKRASETRRRVIQVCRRVFEDLEPSLQGDFSRLLLGNLLPVFSRERDPDVVLEQVSLLNHMVTVFIQFIEYGQASRILTYMERRRRSFEDQEDQGSKIIEKALQVRIDAPTEKMLVDDLTSGDPVRIMNASRLLAGMGDLAVPLLIDIIKGAEDLRARKIAASLIRKGGAEAGERLRNELDLETNPEERSRILDIIDAITSDIGKELGLALGDKNPQVRDAAFRLAERLNDSRTVELLLDLARSQKGKMAVTAIRCLGKINPPEIEGEIISILNKARSDDITIACCNVLGQLASPTSIEALKKVLAPKGFLVFKKKRNPEVRSAAASALSKIQDPKVNETLSAFMNDSDPRIRMVAKAVSESESSGQLDSAVEEVPLRARPSSP